MYPPIMTKIHQALFLDSKSFNGQSSTPLGIGNSTNYNFINSQFPAITRIPIVPKSPISSCSSTKNMGHIEELNSLVEPRITKSRVPNGPQPPCPESTELMEERGPPPPYRNRVYKTMDGCPLRKLKLSDIQKKIIL